MENSETQVWLDFAMKCVYFSKDDYETLFKKCEEIGRLLNHMEEHPEKYLRKTKNSMMNKSTCKLVAGRFCLLPTAYCLLIL